MEAIRSGSPSCQSPGQSGIEGGTKSSPSLQPVSNQLLIRRICWSDKPLSCLKPPSTGSGSQGGMYFDSVTSLICFALLLVSSYVNNWNGADIPSRWQGVQCSKMIGAICWLKVTVSGALSERVDSICKAHKTRVKLLAKKRRIMLLVFMSRR